MSESTMDQSSLNVGRTFVWHEVYAPSSKATVEFCTQALDFGVQDHPMGDFTYRMITRNGQPVAGVVGTSEMSDMGNVPPHWATYLSVDDVDARLAKCESLGAKVVVQPMDVPDVGRMALIEDPQGAHIWLFRPA